MKLYNNKVFLENNKIAKDYFKNNLNRGKNCKKKKVINLKINHNNLKLIIKEFTCQ